MAQKLLKHRPCQVCRHPERAAIEVARLAGVSLKALEAKYGVNFKAVWRHMRDHVSAADKAAIIADIPVQELAARAAEEGMSLLDYLAIVRKAVMGALITASGVGDAGAIARLTGRATEVLRLQAELAGQLSAIGTMVTHTTTNNTAIFVESPMFARLQEMLVSRLARSHPEALALVIDGLNELDGPETINATMPAPPQRSLTHAPNGRGLQDGASA
jgi:hypothetical protein